MPWRSLPFGPEPVSGPLVERSDFLIIGGGIVGLTLALELRRRHPSASVVVLEKEDRVGAHSSGRNSGVQEPSALSLP